MSHSTTSTCSRYRPHPGPAPHPPRLPTLGGVQPCAVRPVVRGTRRSIPPWSSSLPPASPRPMANVGLSTVAYSNVVFMFSFYVDIIFCAQTVKLIVRSNILYSTQKLIVRSHILYPAQKLIVRSHVAT